MYIYVVIKYKYSTAILIIYSRRTLLIGLNVMNCQGDTERRQKQNSRGSMVIYLFWVQLEKIVFYWYVHTITLPACFYVKVPGRELCFKHHTKKVNRSWNHSWTAEKVSAKEMDDLAPECLTSAVSLQSGLSLCSAKITCCVYLWSHWIDWARQEIRDWSSIKNLVKKEYLKKGK